MPSTRRRATLWKRKGRGVVCESLALLFMVWKERNVSFTYTRKKYYRRTTQHNSAAYVTNKAKQAKAIAIVNTTNKTHSNISEGTHSRDKGSPALSTRAAILAGKQLRNKDQHMDAVILFLNSPFLLTWSVLFILCASINDVTILKLLVKSP